MRKLSRKKKFYVYALLDPRSPGPFYYGHWKFAYEPFYIGKGQGKRVNLHAKVADGNTIKSRKISKIRKEGLELIPVIKRACLTEKQALDLEIKFIALIGRLNLREGPLANLTNGGEGHSGFKPTEVTREKRRLARINRTPDMVESILNKTRETWQNKSEKEREIIRKKKQKSHAQRTEAQKALSRQNSKRTEESVVRQSIKTKETWANKSKDEKIAISEKLSAICQSRSSKAKQSRIDKVRTTMNQKTPEEKALISKRISEANIRRWQSTTEADRALVAAKIAASVKEQHRRLGHKCK